MDGRLGILGTRLRIAVLWGPLIISAGFVLHIVGTVFFKGHSLELQWPGDVSGVPKGIVRHEAVNDDQGAQMARDIARRVEDELTYPGQIRVTVIRETRCVEYAK